MSDPMTTPPDPTPGDDAALVAKRPKKAKGYRVWRGSRRAPVWWEWRTADGTMGAAGYATREQADAAAQECMNARAASGEAP